MPGRQSTGPPTIKKAKPKPKKRTQKRSLNALAIAEQQHPTKTKLRQGRLGAAEPDTSGRKRGLGDEDLEEEDDSRRSKRPRAGDKDRFGNEIEGGSDSEGNEWVLGAVDKDDDSDIDSDEAMGESDEERFEGFKFRGSTSTGKKAKQKKASTTSDADNQQNWKIDLNEDNDDADGSDESEGLGDDAIDLADAMDQNSSDDQSSASDDDRGSELSAFSDLSDHEDAADPKKLALLGDFVSSMNNSSEPTSHQKSFNDAQETMTPSEFGITSKQKLTLADLQASITDPSLRKSLKLLAEDTKPSSKKGGIPKKLEVPLAKRQQDRLDRAAAYEKSKETLNRWIDTVKHNRRAEHLSFPLKDPNDPVAQGSKTMLPIVNSQPVTDLEGEIQKILQESGLGPTTHNDEEDPDDAFTELPSNKLSVEEVQAKRVELRRARDLLFREEKRAKRIKKIKSKSFRKVHRKEREKLARSEKEAFAAAGVEDSESERERNDRRRAEERMGQRHRESRWAKGVKNSGRAAWDEDARSGVTDMARRNEELRKRIAGRTVNGDESASSESESSDDEEQDDEDRGERVKSKTLNRLQELDESENDPISNLSSMRFMKNAESLRREENKAMVDSIRRDLEGEETPPEEEQTEAAGRRSYGPLQSKNQKENPFRTTEQKSELEERPASDEENEIRFDNEEDLEIIVDAANSASKPNTKKPSISRNHLANLAKAPHEPSSAIEENPWLSTTTTTHRQKKDRKDKDDRTGAIITNLVAADPESTSSANPTPKPRSALKGGRAAAAASHDISTTHQPTSPPTPAPPKSSLSSDEDEEESSLSNNQPLLPSNDALIRMAFAGDAVVADFATEKAATITSEDSKTVTTSVPGWGSWVGAGLSKGDRKHALNRQVQSTEKGVVEAAKRKDAKRGLDKVIISEKRVKKNAKYLAGSLPHPFETRAQYERSLRLPVGPEWTTKETFQSMTKPRVLVKQGVIEPMRRPII